MKRWINIAITISLFFCLHNQAYAGNRGVNGLIIGGGAGAIVGQSIGRNVESTIIGATVGGILGAVIASESGRGHHRPVVIHERPRRHHVQYHHVPRHNPPRVVYSQSYRHGNKHYYKGQRHKKSHHKRKNVHYSKKHKHHRDCDRPHRGYNPR
ncbi:YMGG-like glycine zipper-containing protein [Desulforhopalus sp. 52FAK]